MLSERNPQDFLNCDRLAGTAGQSLGTAPCRVRDEDRIMMGMRTAANRHASSSENPGHLPSLCDGRFTFVKALSLCMDSEGECRKAVATSLSFSR